MGEVVHKAQEISGHGHVLLLVRGEWVPNIFISFQLPFGPALS